MIKGCLARLSCKFDQPDRLFKGTFMTFETIGDAISNPFGTARLLEAHSTLKRTQEAKMTYDQICIVFPDAAKYSSTQLDGFMQVGADLVAGRTRFNGRFLQNGSEGVPEPA